MRSTPLILLAALLFATTCHAEDWLYTIRPGDELWNLAIKYCGSARYAERLAGHNNLSDVTKIRPGHRLRFPVDWLVRHPVDAEVVAAHGAAWLLTPERRDIEVGQRVSMGDIVETEAGSVAVEFADSSRLMIATDSRVLFNVLTAFGDTGMVDTNVRFYRGRGTSSIQRRQTGSRYRVSTPSGTAAVRGTDFRVGVDDVASITETLTGTVGFIRDTETPVQAGFGLAASADAIVSEKLLDPPAWVTAPGEIALGSAVSWESLAGADRYRVRVLPADDQRIVVADTVTTAAQLELTGIEPGNYLIALRGISTASIEGYDAELAVAIRTSPPRADAPAEPETGQTRLAWTPTAAGPPFTVEVARSAAFESPQQFASESTEVDPGLVPGRYFWRVKDATSTFSDPQTLVVRPAGVSELKVETDILSVSISWRAAEGADSYRLEISRQPDFSTIERAIDTREPAAATTLDRAGAYYARVTPLAGDLTGSTGEAPFTVRAKPVWWPFALLLLPLLAL